MSTTTKEPMPSPTMIAAGPDGSRRTDAVGAEIPVIVHASRYSAAKGVGKQLPPVHEETRTVIVFPQGAVVRLTANMTVGELVVLTNRQTGADALCRVVNVKTQPGIQNYVNLEFTQRAPGFWGECIQGDRAEVPPAPMPVASPVAISSPVSAEPKSVSRELLTPVAPEPGFASPSLQRGGIASGLSSPASMEPAAGQKAAAARSQSQSWSKPSTEAMRGEAPSSTKKMVMIGVAAAILVGAGIGAGMLLMHGSHSSPQPQTAAATNGPAAASAADASNQPDLSENAAPAQPTAVASSSAPAPTPTPAVAVETRPVTRTEAPRSVAPAPVAPVAAVVPSQPSAPNVNVGRISAPVAKSLPRVAANEAPPVPIVGAQASFAGGTLSGGLLGGAASNAAVPPPVLPKGGEILQPKLISSVSETYPPAARSAHIQGDVVVEAVVDATGKVTSVKAISGPLLLQPAAVDAVRSWKYQPAQLDGKPIEVHTQVSLSFHLQ